jgi:putative ABC transport system permease protein
VQAHSLDGIFGYAGPAGVQATIRDENVPTCVEVVSGEFFSTLGVSACAGLTLTGNYDQSETGPVTVLSYGYWQDHCGSDPSTVGKMLELNGVVFTIAGVAPKEFCGLHPIAIPDMWIRSSNDVF